MDSPLAPESLDVRIPTHGPMGAMTQVEYVGVKMKVYPIDESRLAHLTNANTRGQLFFSLCSATLFLVIGKLMDNPAAFVPSSPAFNSTIYVCAVASALFGYLGFLERRESRTVIQAMKSSAVPSPIPGSVHRYPPRPQAASFTH